MRKNNPLKYYEGLPPAIGVSLNKEKILSSLFLLPALLFLIVTNVYPLIYSLRLSFFKWNMLVPFSEPVFVGLKNYINNFTSPEVLNSAVLSLIFVVVALFFEFIIGFGLAAIITGGQRFMGLTRSILLIPVMMTPVTIGVLFRYLLNYDYGVFNWVLSLFGIEKQAFLGDSIQAMGSVIAAEIWWSVPVVAFILAAGIQSLPMDLYKAADVDGASRWQIFWTITIPLLKPVIYVVLMLRIMDLFKVFDIIYTLTYGGPGKSTETFSIFIYKEGLKFFHVGSASSLSWLFLIFIIAVSIGFLRKVMKG